MEIKLKTLNNKSRQGTYLYIKAPKKPGRYYKYHYLEGELDATTNYYNDRYIKKKKSKSLKRYKTAYHQKTTGQKGKRTRETRQAEQYIARIKKQGTLLSKIKKGITTAKIQNTTTTNQGTITKAKQELLKSLVLDNKLLKIITTEENFKKLTQRLEYTFEAKNEKGQTLIQGFKHGTTPEKAIQELKEALQGNQAIKSRTRNPFTDKIQNKNWQTETKVMGNIKNIEMTITFRRG